MNLSGGQQARINLARAIYKECQIYLLDDSLTALDAHVQDFIFEECILKFLSNKIVILVSQTAHHIEQADTVIVLNSGKITFSGTPSKEVSTIVIREIEKTKEIEETIDQSQKRKIDETDYEETVEESIPLKQKMNGEQKSIYGEGKKTGGVDFSTYYKYLSYGGGIFLMILNVVIFGLSQGAESYSDMLLTEW